MTAKEFWEDDPMLFWSYRISYIQRKQTEQKIQNQMMWVQGAYIFDAVTKAIANSFSKNARYTYLDKPFDLDGSRQIEKTELQYKSTQQTNYWASFKERLENNK